VAFKSAPVALRLCGGRFEPLIFACASKSTLICDKPVEDPTREN